MYPFFSGFLTFNLTRKDEIPWGENLTFINIHFFPLTHLDP